jgi:dTDP-3-amino-2,3,6-trideoxy-4-keto-D-glucose/dTDP-3-amino-3,4,6-trideoxy-alpha-D-glucose/dTDP-2,6-dideoxy-D-kanosamine transaminase
MTEMSIPLWSYREEYAELREDILAACDRVFQSGVLLRGEEGKAFERAMASAHGVAGGVGVNSGTDAIYIALAALGVKAGDEVITVPNTAVPTVSAIATLGATPVFVDVDEDFLMDVDKLEAAITERTRAIIPVHLYGQCVDMDPLLEIARRNGLNVVEDVAQAQGASYKGRPAGSMGDASTFSFYPTKVLGAYGDGGMILSNSEETLSLARSLRFYGMETTYYAERNGYNSRLDEVQAAILSLKLPMIQKWVNRRREIAAQYSAAFDGTAVTPPRERAYGQHAYYIYVVEHADRDGMIERLAAKDVMCNVSYRWPIHIMRGYQHLGYREGDFPVAERKAARIFSLPMYPYLNDDQVATVIDAVKAVM